ncbi:non-ribosomal peptide synthetase [Virgibacillus proomii]|uniref:non-ribosomal peptide synthetase n=1 Tax=Virgibacillus proomii TaxID=84407 RepID=UPI001C117B0A|nr:non-ribosomal peptide synthetase [Virgibacillus proomii]MBU5265933.1 amino acid adenylation domain-containing protein [Virgibacillus proomii]
MEKYNNLLLSSKSYIMQRDYWLEKIEKANTDSIFHKPSINLNDQNKTKSIQKAIPVHISEKLIEISKNSELSLYCILLVSFNVLIYKETGRMDNTVLIPLLKESITTNDRVLIQSEFLPNNTFKELLFQTRENLITAYNNADYPFEEIIKELNHRGFHHYANLLGIMFASRDIHKEIHVDKNTNLIIWSKKVKKDIQLIIEYSESNYSNSQIDNLISNYLSIIETLLNKPEVKLADLKTVGHNESKFIFEQFNNTKNWYPQNKSVVDIFEEKVLQNPNKIAVEDNGRSITYVELNRRANQLARRLRQKGIGVEEIVGVMLPRSIELIISLLGIWKTGAAYLPLDPSNPTYRNNHIIHESNTSFVITTNPFKSDIDFTGETIDINDKLLSELEYGNLEREYHPSQLAYVIYTSGTTGQPKGVMIEQGSVVNLLYWFSIKFPMDEEDILLQRTSIAFDASVWELFGWIFSGSTLSLLDPLHEKNVEKIIEKIDEGRITIAQFVPSLLRSVIYFVQEHNEIDKLSSLKQVFVGGESLPINTVNEFNQILNKKFGTKLCNVYGPTEATVDVSFYECNHTLESDRSVPIGKPINNAQMYILNDDLRLLEIGSVGELYIGGDSLARGYLNNPDLTRLKFIKSPFVDGEYLYKTGDLAKLLPNGNIEFIGRKDQQVKVRGYRIEIGEVEHWLHSLEDIKEAVVLTRDSGELCGFITATRKIPTNEIKYFLLQYLPNYMVPAEFIQLEQLPLTWNGKIDKKKLLSLEYQLHSDVPVVKPNNNVESEIINVFEKVLNMKPISTESDFFDLGGNSLKAATVVARLYKTFNVRIPMYDFFENPTAKKLGQLIMYAKKHNYQPIKRVQKREYYPTTSAQKRIYILNQVGDHSVNYNMPEVLLLKGNVNVKKVDEIFNQLVQRHESFRTSFHILHDEIVQLIHENVDFKVDYLELDKESLEQEIENFIKPFNLRKALLLRVKLIKCSSNEHYLFIDMHHIISDGYSVGLLVKEFEQLYLGNTLPDLELQYKDFSVWQEEQFNTEQFKEKERYWLKMFEGEIPVLDLPTDFPRPSVMKYEGDSVQVELEKNLTDRIKEVARENGVTPYIVLLSAYFILLSKYTRQNDLVVAYPTAGRPHPDLEYLVGMFVNTVAMRMNINHDESFKLFLSKVKETSFDIYDNQDYQFEMLVEKLKVERDISRNTLFDTMFAMRDTDITEIVLPDLSMSRYSFKNKKIKFDIYIEMLETENHIMFELFYRTDLFKDESIERFIKHYINILHNITINQEIELSDIEIITNEEKEMLRKFNQSETETPNANKGIATLFEEQVKKNPESYAVIFGQDKMTYKELNQKANALAQYLQQQGVSRGDYVGVLLNRSIDLIVAVVAIIKSGGAYIPIDPSYPYDRIEFMLKSSRTNMLITNEAFVKKIEYTGAICTMDNVNVINTGDERPKIVNLPSDPAYVIYTSGSTGEPKGVLVEQKNVINLVNNPNYVRFEPGDRILQTGSIAFDASTFEIWGALLNGLTLSMVEKDIILSSEKLGKEIMNNGITTMFLTSPLFTQLAEDNPSIFAPLKFLLIGGDILSTKHINIVRDQCRDVNVVHVYGPTETTTFATSLLINKEYNESIPIGKPINNTNIYILDEFGKTQPVGVPGEIYIGGKGVARGYINSESLTEEKFINIMMAPNDRVYRTGDIGKWLPDGTIEFIGRTDYMVKIRGFRVEIGEIEEALFKHEEIKETVVIVNNDSYGNKYLCAYYVSDQEIPANKLRDFISNNLPEYMIPSYFIFMNKLPLTINGKVDRKLLPEPKDVLIKNKIIVQPRNEMQRKMSTIWSEILELEQVGINEDFFELGGHSLKASILISRISKEFAKEVPLKQLFMTPTIEGLSNYLETAMSSTDSEIIPIENRLYYPVSYAQKRQYTLHFLAKDNITYNIPDVYLLSGEVNSFKIEQTLEKLVKRHDSLRTSFHMIDGELMQRIESNIDIDFTHHVLEKDSIHYHIREFIKPFDLSKAPLFRVELIEVDGQHLLLFDMHHIIGDGTSMSVLMNDFITIYNGESLQNLKLQYKDFANWQNQQIKLSDKIKKQENYWLSLYQDEIPILNLPTDYSRPKILSYEGDKLTFKLDKELTYKLNRLATVNGATLFMVLLSAYNIFLSKISGDTDIVIGSPIAGRNHPDVENIVGMFVNTLALRNKLNPNDTFLSYLDNVKSNVLEAFDNQDYPFDLLVQKVDKSRDTSRNPLFDSMFVLQNMKKPNMSSEGLRLRSYEFDFKVSKVDLELFGEERNDELWLGFRYRTVLFKQETIERMSEYFVHILRSIVDNSEECIKNFGLPPKDLQNIVYGFNQTEHRFMKTNSLQELFESQVKKKPNELALIFRDNEITYGELNTRANQLAHFLLKNKLDQPKSIPIIMERSPEMIISILAVLKSGFAYLPIDSDFPIDRINNTLDDSGADFILTNIQSISENLKHKKVINVMQDGVYGNESTDPKVKTNPNDLAYIIYTSGTTGKPKGVQITHRNVINLLEGVKQKIDLSQTRSVLCLTSISFDIFVVETILPLVNGLRIVLADDNIKQNPKAIREIIKEKQIDLLQFTPSRLKQLTNRKSELDFLKEVKSIIVGGEPFNMNLYSLIRQHSEARIFNGYGPSETCVYSTMEEIDGSTDILIGSPLANTQIYILNENHQPQPIGVVGELYIAGEGIAKGYLNNSTLTNEKFVTNPFSNGEKMYKTGDLGKWKEDGKIFFIGRKDNQVKVRGNRIELGEVESHLLEHHSVKEAVVLVFSDDDGNNYLNAYIVSDSEWNVSNLRTFLKQKLPNYMIPSNFIPVPEIPLTTNGKIDKNRLPKFEEKVKLDTIFEEPRTELEKKILDIWKKVLGNTQIGINDDFFELGGHSLLVIKLEVELEKENIDIEHHDIYTFNTVKKLSEHIESVPIK